MRKTITAVALAVAAALLTPAAPAQADTSTCHQQFAGGSPCHPDTGHCASYFEQNQLRDNMRRKTVRRILGTAGHTVGKNAMINATGGYLGLLGLDHGDVDTPKRSERLVKSYPTCAEDGVPAKLLIEYRVRHGVGRVTSTLWE